MAPVIKIFVDLAACAAPAVAASADHFDVGEGDRRPAEMVSGERVVLAALGAAVGAPGVLVDGLAR